MAEQTESNTNTPTDVQTMQLPLEESAPADPKPKRRRRAKKSDDEVQEVPEAKAVDQEGKGEEPAQTSEQPQGEASPAKDENQDQQGGQRKRRRQGNNSGAGQNRQKSSNGRNQGSNNRRRNRRGGQADVVQEPTLKREELEKLKVAELKKKAAELEIDYVGMRKAELVESVYQAAAISEGFKPIEGVLDIQNEGYGFIRTGNYMKGDGDAFVHQQMVRQFGLRSGDRIVGTLSPVRSGNK